ncbi:inorganic phosphate transporter [Bradymonas sediminis]|uniref:Phosphate transporter n=1 Tax=Bradymonas sediminis TaxID=1548548 RepID=A0A2Z4FQZ3_9DELT|nr:inorganic phosphate transporter [Bradymonas sediminis]AWV91342.1 phosphate permease [Bradymonas sediminis]
MALAFGFYMAWTIGANDAANAMGTSVGSGAITFKEAVIIAAVFEFSGAILAGSGVTDTMRKGIIDPALFNQMPQGAEIFALGMLASLMAAAIWLHFAAFVGWPVSTTHSIVGAIAGFGVASVGMSNVDFGTLGIIVSSWVVSPVAGGLLAFLIFTAIRKTIIDTPNPVLSVKKWGPAFAFPIFLVLALVLFTKGLKNVDLPLDTYGIAIISVLTGIIASTVLWWILRKIQTPTDVDRGEHETLRDVHHSRVERVFRYLQTITACFVAFAHGSNDVANAIGPLAGIVSLFDGTTFQGSDALGSAVPVPTWVLMIGGVGILVGLATYGYKVIETIGTKITDITPSRGFAAEFGAATTILIGSKIGLPLSTTHTIVGAVIGVGFARGMNALNLQIIWQIAKAWVYTIPFTAVLTVVIFKVLQYFFLV